MTFSRICPSNSMTLPNILAHNVVWANQLFVFHWLRTHAMIDIT